MSFVVPAKEMDYQLPPPPNATAAPTPLGHQVPVGVMQGTLTHVQAPQQDESQRWTQYQQLWRQHVYMNGTTNGGCFVSGGGFRFYRVCSYVLKKSGS